MVASVRELLSDASGIAPHRVDRVLFWRSFPRGRRWAAWIVVTFIPSLIREELHQVEESLNELSYADFCHRIGGLGAFNELRVGWFRRAVSFRASVGTLVRQVGDFLGEEWNWQGVDKGLIPRGALDRPQARSNEPRESGWIVSVEHALQYHPELQGLFRLFIGEPILKYVVLFLVLGLGVVGMSMPRIWRTTPDGVVPVIRVSLLDRMQAWSLARNAGRLTERGRHEEAAPYWNIALANNFGDTEILRGTLRNQFGRRPSAGAVERCVAQVDWLMQLTRTNRVDLLLGLRALDHFQHHGLVLDWLDRTGLSSTGGPSEFEVLRLKAHFHVDDSETFFAGLRGASEVTRKDPTVQLYELAARSTGLLASRQGASLNTRMVSGRFGTIWATARRLRLAYTQHSQLPMNAFFDHYVATPRDHPSWLDSRRLALIVSASRYDVEAYATALRDLASASLDTLDQHLVYWDLLARLGRPAEARRLIEGTPLKPWHPGLAVATGRLVVRLGLTDSATNYYREAVGQFPGTSPLWLDFGELLIREERWDELVRRALEVRSGITPAPGDVLPFTYFWEGLAAWRSNRRDAARRQFVAIAGTPGLSVATGRALAARILLLGDVDSASHLIASLEDASVTDPSYWLDVFHVGVAQRDLETMLRASRIAHDLDPESHEAWEAYSLALLIGRTSPKKALDLTRRLVDADPNSLMARMNWVHALLLNGSLSEADTALQGIQLSEGAHPMLVTNHHFAQFELAAGLEQWDRLIELRVGMDEAFLMPSTLQRVNHLLVKALREASDVRRMGPGID